MLLIDTNILLRYLLQDHAELSAKANEIIANHDVVCLYSVVYEAIHVMKSVYQIDRSIIAHELHALFADQILFSENQAVILKTLTIFQETSLDFIDCLLIAKHMIEGDEIASFDKKLNNHMKKLSHTPFQQAA